MTEMTVAKDKSGSQRHAPWHFVTDDYAESDQQANVSDQRKSSLSARAAHDQAQEPAMTDYEAGAMTPPNQDAPDSKELLPCPFCGGKPSIVTLDESEPDNVGGQVVVCGKCQACSVVVFPLKESARDKLHEVWNRRARKEAIQTAAMALRFVRSLDRYQFKPGEQHKQEALTGKGAGR